MAAGPSRSSRVTRVELTADQLLGADLTPARLHKHRSKNAPKVITVEDLLGPSLTIAASASSSRSSSRAGAPARSPPPPPPQARARPPPRLAAAPRAASPPGILIPNRERVTADEVLRTGLPLRSLQAAKARARSAQALSLVTDPAGGATGSGSGSGGGSSTNSGSRLSGRRDRSRPRVVTAEELAGPGPETDAGYYGRRPRSAGGGAGSASSPTSRPSGGQESRIVRPSTSRAATSSGGSSTGNPTNNANAAGAGSSSGSTQRGRGLRSGHLQRSSSQGSTRTLPMYTREPGESEVVIGRGAEELEDEIPITVMTPVAEDGPTLVVDTTRAASPSYPESISPVSPSPRDADGSDFGRHLSPLHAISPIPVSVSPLRTMLNEPIPPTPYPDEVPSYEAAISMSSSSDLRLSSSPQAVNIPLPASPVILTRSPVFGMPSPSSPSPSSPGSSEPSSPAEGAESPRRRFPFISLFHSHSHSNGGGSSSRSRIRGGSVSGLPSPSVAATAPGPSPERLYPSPPASPRPAFHRSSQSASGSMLDLLSRSWQDSYVARSRSERGGA